MNFFSSKKFWKTAKPVAIAVIASIAIWLLFVQFGLVGITRASLPGSKPVGTDEFNDRFGTWYTFLDFQVTELESGKWRLDAVIEYERNSELPDFLRKLPDLVWKLEVYQNGELLEQKDLPWKVNDPEIPEDEKQELLKSAAQRGKRVRFFSAEYRANWLIRNAGSPQFVSYFARRNGFLSACPISSIMSPNSGKGSASPLRFLRKRNLAERKIELNNPRFLQDDNGKPELNVGYEVLDANFPLGDKTRHAELKNFYFVVENEFGMLLSYLPIAASPDNTIRLPLSIGTSTANEQQYLRGDLKVYLVDRNGSEPAGQNNRRIGFGIAETLNSVSNILEVSQQSESTKNSQTFQTDGLSRVKIPESTRLSRRQQKTFSSEYGPWIRQEKFSYQKQGGQWTFKAELSADPKLRRDRMLWVVEVYQDGMFINEFNPVHKQLESSDAPVVLQSEPWPPLDMHPGFPDNSKVEFISYFARPGHMATRVPVSSVLGNRIGTSHGRPVAYSRNHTFDQRIELFDLEVSQPVGDVPVAKFKFKITDGDFQLDRYVDLGRRSEFRIVLENEFGAIQMRTLTSMPRDNELTVRLDSSFGTRQYETEWWRKGTIKIYMAKIKQDRGTKVTKQVGLAESIQILSNFLEVPLQTSFKPKRR